MNIQSLNNITSFNSQTRFSFPSGVILIWSGASENIPQGWYLCDGTNSTPNLQGLFIRHDSSSILASGGESFNDTSHTHAVTGTTSSSGAHTHTFASTTTNSVAGHTHTVSGTTGSPSATGLFRAGTSTSISLSTYAHTHTISATSSTSASHSHTVAAVTSSSSGSHSHTMADSLYGSSAGSVDNRPPYYVLCYIMKG